MTNDLWYFGCIETSGHYFWDRDNRYRGTLGFDGLPKEIRSQIDGGFCPDNRQLQGPAKLTHLAGWTLLGFWDRSIDQRFGSNSVFLTEGIFTFDQMVKMARERFPSVWDRLRFEVTEDA